MRNCPTSRVIENLRQQTRNLYVAGLYHISYYKSTRICHSRLTQSGRLRSR